MAYTSPSTALNHTEVQNAAVSPATTPEMAKVHPCSLVASTPDPIQAIFAKMTVDQHINIAAKAVHMPDMMLTANACAEGLLLKMEATQANIRPINKNKGAPGGCTTCSLAAPKINSPQSQRLPERSAQKKYTMNATAKVNHPAALDCL